jgi:serine/threonine-protein kinase
MSLRFGDITFDESRRQLRRGDQSVHVSPKAFQLLGILIAETPRAFSKDELQQRLWPDTFVTEGNLASLIAELRSALGDDARKPRYIRTVHGYGYSFAGTILEEPNTPERAEAGGLPSGGSLRRAAVIVPILLLVVVSAIWLFARSRSEAKNITAPRAIRSIAVLPFDTRGISQADSHLGLGLADLIITRLSNVDALTIRPTSSVRSFAGREFDSREAGRKLDVDAVLEGSIRSAGDRVRITAQLIDVKRAKPIWADQFDETRAEMFTIEDRISARVADAILVRLSPDEKTLLAKRYTASPEAYQLYVQGRFHILRMQQGGGPEEPRAAAKLLTAAIEKDPGYALAWMELARAHAWIAIGDWGAGVLSEHYAIAEKAALRARELDPELPEALVPLAQVRMYWHLDYAGAERELQSVLRARPRDPDALSLYGYLLQSLGRVDEEQAIRGRLVEADPLNPRSHWAMANGYLTARRYDLGRKKVEDLLAMNPNHSEAHIGMIRVLLAEGKYEDAISHARKRVAADGRPRNRAFLGVALARAGRKAEARKVRQELQVASGSESAGLLNLAILHVALGENEQALSVLDKAVEDRDWAIRLKTEPLLDPLRNEPRFQSLLRRAGFDS